MRYLALGVGVALLVGAVAGYFLILNRYEAFALLKVSNQSPAVLARPKATPEEFQVYKRTQVQLILTGAVLRRALADPRISELGSTRTIRSPGSRAAWLFHIPTTPKS
jgi:hypothetical protein